MPARARRRVRPPAGCQDRGGMTHRRQYSPVLREIRKYVGVATSVYPTILLVGGCARYQNYEAVRFRAHPAGGVPRHHRERANIAYLPSLPPIDSFRARVLPRHRYF